MLFHIQMYSRDTSFFFNIVASVNIYEEECDFPFVFWVIDRSPPQGSELFTGAGIIFAGVVL